MKPIFIVIIPLPEFKSDSNELMLKLKNYSPDLFTEYHVICASADIQMIDFKILNGTQENYDSIEDLKAKIVDFL